MSPFDQLSQDLKRRFPNVEIDVRKADEPNGFQFMTLSIGDFEVGIEWKKECGFGVSSFQDDMPPTDGLFEAPKEWCDTEQAIFHRVVSLFDQRTRP